MEISHSPTWTAPSIASWQRFVLRSQTPARPGLYLNTPMPPLRAWGPWFVAGLLFTALMFSFLTVVRQGVARADQNRLDDAYRARAELDCKSERPPLARQACLDAYPARPGAPVVAAVTALASVR